MKNFDVIIVGSGASGASAAWNLSKSNLTILCLEQGPIIPEESYPRYGKDWEDRKNKDFSLNPNIRSLPSDYPINNENSPIDIANFNAVGGATILYSGHFPRFHPSDFKTFSLDGVGSDWPFTYEDLEPFYNLNDTMTGVSGLSGDPAYPVIPKLLPPVPIDRKGEVMASGFHKLGWHCWPSYSAIITEDYNGRKKYANDGPYNLGPPAEAKSSVNVTYWPLALKNGVELRPNSRVIKITTDKYLRADGVIYVDEKGVTQRVRSSLVILACNGIGTPRLLLNSANKNFPNGLANSSGLVGKNLMLHPLGFVEGFFPDYLGSQEGPQGCCISSHNFYETDIDRNFKRGYSMHVLRSEGPLETAISGYRLKKIFTGKNIHEDFFKRYGSSIPMAIICEDLPEETNMVELDTAISDSNGMHGIKVNYKLSENSKKMLSHGLMKGKEVMKASGAKSILAHGPIKNTGWHLMGTTKMGYSITDSVVNEHGQAHDIKNLVIIDSSVFATSSGVNPAATIQALALKLSTNILKNPSSYE